MEDAYEFYKKTEDTREEDNYRMHNLIQKHNPTKVLEVGCGNGEMLNLYEQAIGVDINKSMVEYAKKQGNKVVLGDVTNKDFIDTVAEKEFEIVCSNYVFTELTTTQLQKAFKNIYEVLGNNGKMYFTITNPKERHRKDLPGYSVVFDKPHIYESKDVPFTVLLEDMETGELRDVGIRDYHNTTETYINLLEQYFSKVTVHPLNKGLNFDHALLFEVHK